MPKVPALLEFEDLDELRLYFTRRNNTVAIVMETGGIYSYDGISLAVDDGESVIRPEHLGENQGGRWLMLPAGAAPSGPPGTWTLVDSGTTGIAQNSTVDLSSVPLSTVSPAKEIYMAVVTPLDKSPGGDISISQGSTLTAPPNSCIYYSMVIDSSSNVTLRIRSGTTLPGISPSLNWAIYKVLLP